MLQIFRLRTSLLGMVLRSWPVRHRQWPYLEFTRYIDAHGVDWLLGHRNPQQAFYRARMIGGDGVAFSSQTLA